MINSRKSSKKVAYLATAIATNILLGSINTFSGVPFLFLDSIGTIFISSHFKLKYGLLTAIGTHFLLSVIHGPLTLPFMLVGLSIAVVSHFFKSFMHSYKKAILAGIIIALIGAFFSVPVRIVLYSGFKGIQKSASDLVFILLNHKELGEINRSKRGYYQLTEFKERSYMNDYELFMIFKILFASRGFHKHDLEKIYHKLFTSVDDKPIMDKLLANERFYYDGVPKTDIYPSLKLLVQAMLNQQIVEFTYTKNGETKVFKRQPIDIYFSDLYFFMISAKHTVKDDTDFNELNKFRINNMKKIKVLNERQSLDYTNRFQGGVLRNQTALPFFGEPITLIIDFYYDPVYVLDRFPNSIIKQINKDGSHRIEIPANNGYGVKMWLLEQGSHVKVISPKYMQQYLVDNMKKTLSYYDINLNE